MFMSQSKRYAFALMTYECMFMHMMQVSPLCVLTAWEMFFWFSMIVLTSDILILIVTCTKQFLKHFACACGESQMLVFVNVLKDI